jgi:CheY-like chemotaxis protein
MMQKIATVLAFTMDAKNIEFTVRIDPAIPCAIHADEQRLSQVITNFLSNAAKFTPEGGKVRLSASRVGTDANKEIEFVRIAVSDTGIGISEEFMPKIFNSFEQADNSVSRKYGGTGLGLAISKKIVELMGGTLSVDSVVGEGSTFSFVVSVKRAQGTVGTALPQGVNWANLKVLAVDDSEETRMYFEATGEALGFDCDTAKDAYEALALMRQPDKEYNVIFVDWRMPGMDGLAFAREVKKLDAGHVIVIMISSSAWSEIADQAKEAGVEGFIPKPLFTSAITDMINNLMLQPDDEKSDKKIEEMAGDFEGVRIMLVEDVDINREIVESLFDGSGAVITMAENGLEAVEKFSENPGAFDVIFMDIHMPVKDGYAAAREIRAMDISKAKTIPIIAMTANVFKKDVDKCLACGMNDHVGKPIDIHEVFTKLKRQLRMSVRT